MWVVYKKGLSYRQKPKNDYRIEVTKQLNYRINDNEAFKGRHTRGREGAFSKRLLLPFGHLIVSILRVGKRGLQREMDSFFQETENEDFSIRRITKSDPQHKSESQLFIIIKIIMTSEPSPYLLLSELKETDFWSFFHLRITDSKKIDTGTRYFLKPGGHQTEVDLSIQQNQKEQITESALYIKRDWLFGEPYGLNPFALDIVRSFISATVSPADTNTATKLQASFDMNVVYRYYEMFRENVDDEADITKIMKVYLGLDQTFLLTLTHTKIEFGNQTAGNVGRLVIKTNINFKIIPYAT